MAKEVFRPIAIRPKVNKEMVTEALKVALPQLKANTPVDEHVLIDTADVRDGEIGYFDTDRVGRAGAAPAVEFGTRYMRAQFPIRRAVTTKSKEIQAKLAELIIQNIKKKVRR